MAGPLEGVGSILGGVGGLLFGGQGGKGTRKDIAKLWSKLEQVDFDMSRLSAPELQVVAQLMPELYDAQIQGEAQQIEGSPEMAEKQATALAQMEDIGREGMTDVDKLQAVQAKEAVAQANRRTQNSILQNLAARGQLGSGDELAARLAGSEQSGQAAADMGADLVRQAALRRLSGIESAAGMAGNIRGQDVAEQTTNANLADRFNALASQLMTQAARDNAATRMGAQEYNVGQKQRVADTNELARADTAARNQEYLNKMRQQSWANKFDTTQQQAGAMGGIAGAEDAEATRRRQAIASLGQGVGGLGDSAFGFGF